MTANEEERPILKLLNEHIICPLCRGYLIDATTLVECLHSFCRGCIVRRLSSGARICPVCNAAAQPPLLSDVKLQRLVYLIVPGLFRSELERRRHFRLVNPQCPALIPPTGAPELTFDDLVSLSLSEIVKNCSNDDAKSKEPKIQSDYLLADLSDNATFNSKENDETKSKVRYLKCPAGVTVRHLLRLLMLKRGWDDSKKTTTIINQIEILGEMNDDKKTLQVLNPSWTLLDLACIFKWERESPMKLLYRIVGKEENNSSLKSSYCGILEGDNTSQVIEDSQRPPTPPPSPKPIPYINMSCSLKETRSQSSGNVDYSKDSESKKPRCEVTPVMRSPEPQLENKKVVKSNKTAKLEHHKRRKRRNKRVIAEITTTPREDMLKLKVRLTPCPPRVTQNNQTKEKILQMRAARREKINKSNTLKQRTKVQDDNTKILEDSDGETIEEIIDSIPDEVVQIAQDINNSKEPEKEPKSTAVAESDEKPKDEEVLRQLGLVNTHEMDREKLEKQFRESKANRVRSLLAEKQMRDTLESIKIMSSTTKVKEPTPNISAIKKKGPPPLAPLRTVKTPSFSTTFLPNRETPLDLSNAGSKTVLDLSANPLAGKQSSFNNSTTVTSAATSTSKSKEERKSQDSNLRTLSDAAVSLLGNSSADKIEEGSTVGNKVALRIPQLHQRLSGFGVKMKPNLGIRHIPNPQAIVASQFRNQRANFFNASQRPP